MDTRCSCSKIHITQMQITYQLIGRLLHKVPTQKSTTFPGLSLYSECSPLQKIQHEAKCGRQLFIIQLNLFTYGLYIFHLNH